MGNKDSRNTTPDPATGLSPRDRFLIEKSWAEVSDPAELKENAVEFFVQLFQKFPHMKKYFARFGDLDESKIRSDPNIRAHALGVMYYLTSYVQNMGDPSTLVALVEKLSDAHIARGITPQDFKDLASIFVPYLKYILGKRKVCADTEAAWGKLLGAQNAIFEGRSAEAAKS